MNYQPVIGLEIHTELATSSKIFCGCSTLFGAPPNTHTCPVCLGLPGVLPVLNKLAVEYALRTALALNCEVASCCTFDRKNYYYPDLPKNYQISQNYQPLASHGYLDIYFEQKAHRVGINNIHLEEDAGKNVHTGNSGLKESSLVDFNRTGIPLLEIVTEPHLHSIGAVQEFMESLRSILRYIEVSDCKMEEGSLRFEANVSIRQPEDKTLGPRVEMKNLNSFKVVLKALEHEIVRQTGVLEKGKKVKRETRLWDEKKEITAPMRGKEEAHDYRYFPEPDLVPLVVKSEWIEEIRAGLPELPEKRERRFVEQYNLPEYDARILTGSREIADFYEETAALFPDAKVVSNWIMGELLRSLRDSGKELGDCALTAAHLAELLQLVEKGIISGTMAKAVFAEMFITGKKAEEVVNEQGLTQISGREELLEIVNSVMEDNPKSVQDFRSGKQKAITFLIGQVMRKTKGKANPKLVGELLREKLH